MYNLRDNLMGSIIKELKITDNTFNKQIIKKNMSHIADDKLQMFYEALFGTQHAFLLGLDRVAKVAEQFKPLHVDHTEEKAKELIALVHSINNQVFEDAKNCGAPFVDLLKIVKFPNVNEDDIAILNQVKPYTDYKQLVAKISCYRTSLEQLTAFKNAIEYSNSYSGAIENATVKKMIKG